jgi:hypothetical protein
MPYLLERHKVRDYDRWREVFDADAVDGPGCVTLLECLRATVGPPPRCGVTSTS